MQQTVRRFKASTKDQGEGSFDAVVSTFGVVDSQREVIEKGAFTDSLAKGDIPILWDHQWDDIWSHIGMAKGEETDEGLLVHATLDLDNPNAQQAYKLLQQGRVKEFSIGGFEDPADVTTDDDGTRHVSKFDLREVSLTLAGANPETRVIDVKSALKDLDSVIPAEEKKDASPVLAALDLALLGL